MTRPLSIALAQLNPIVGDIAGNLARLGEIRAASGGDLIVTPECFVSGYPPEDLVRKPAFMDAVEAAVARFAQTRGPAVLLGTPWREGGKLFNAALLIEEGRIAARRYKHNLPNYGVFDEIRVFDAGPLPEPVEFRGRRLGVMICEDMWFPEVSGHLAGRGAELLIALNASPFESDKPGQRRGHAASRVGETGLPLLYVNQVGGQDELVFDGGSFAMTGAGDLAARLPAFAEAVESVDFPLALGPVAEDLPGLEAIYRAMMLGLSDYVRKNGFPGVVLGMSGGIDSALSAAVAVDALGRDRVRLVMMPSPFTSRDSLEDAAEAARMLGCRIDTVRIGPAMGAFHDMLAPALGRAPEGIAAENIQPRIRGLVLMALSNETGAMLLTTGNKSEMSVGYATLYGDMCGGFSVLKDVYKMTVFALSRWRNGSRPGGALGPDGPVMPERIITKPPTAELKPDQTDQDTLPPYEALDAILHGLVEEELGVAEITARGFDRLMVERVWRMLDRAEYKRRQSPPGVKLTRRAFGRDRRYPITNRFTGILEG
jgi:NAD+ synthase